MPKMPISLAVTATKLRSGELSLFEYLNKLESYFNQYEPDVLAFVAEDGRFERLHREAKMLLERFPVPEFRPPLFGIPIAVKDIFHVDGFLTRAGSNVPSSVIQGGEAESVTLLRQEGALILGKTVTTEFAYFGPGPTRNPHNLKHTPGGSSSGSAAAVGAGMCLMAFGTQTIGSVNRPAAFCGIVGYKPSFDRISKEGVIPLSPSLDHVGIFTPTVFDVELVAELLCRQWQVAGTSRKPVLAVPEGPYMERATAEGLAHFQDTCQRLVDAGYELKSVPAMPDFDEIYARHNLIVAAEAAQVHVDWYKEHKDLYHSKTVELIEKGHQVEIETLNAALTGRAKLRQDLTRLMDSHSVDLWVSPAAPGPAPEGLHSTGDPVMNLPWTHSGLPSLSLPSGYSKGGLPLGLQIVGHWYGDEVMLQWAADIENVVRPLGS